MADGSIIIETGLDNTGLEQGIQAMQQTMQRAVTEMQNQLRNLGNDSRSSIETAAQSVSNLQSAMQNAGATAAQQLSSSLEQAAQNTSQNIDNISDSLQDMTEQAGQAGEELSQNIGDSLGDVGDTINENVREPLEQLGDTLGGLDDSLGGLGDGLTEPLEDLPEPLDDVESGLVHIRDGIEDIERISPNAFGRSISDIDRMDRELQEAEKSAERVKETFSKLGSHVVDAMKKAGAAATAAFGVAVGAAVKVGTDFESGMSQVAATMGITVDEIAAGSQEFESLSQAAKNAGATTQFSATQASEALNYLALAGYDAEKSITALPTVLNLAAAGGIDLGYASDMVTDSMSALGLSTNQLEGFVDQLAKTSQKSNTNIAQLGEGILTVGGTAKDLAGGTVELNTALGILADNGIKGAEGGTALRNMILSLSAPTDTARKAMEELGLEVFDAEGKLRPLNETFQDLNSKLGEMSDEDRINVLNTMFNKVDLKSVNALLANSGERFDELSGYIRDSAGAAEDMAETMNDNLKGKLTILGSALEGLGIEMYEEFQQPLKEAAETAIKSVDSISASLKSGKLSESMQTVARGIGTIVSKAAELAIGALPKLIDGFAFLVDHAKLLGTVLASTAGAVATFKGAMLINDVVKSWNAAATAVRMFSAGMTSSLTGAQAVVGGLTGNISKLGAITAALGGPMGVGALAIAGVTAGLIALHFATNDEAKAMKEMKESTEEAAKELENRTAAWEEMQEASRKQISLNAEEIDSTKDLVDELESLVDENGKVGENKERVKFITDKINELAPDSIKWVDDETIAYQKEADAIKKALDQKKAAMAINELQDDKSTAQKNMKESLEQQVELRKQIEETTKKYLEATEKLEEADKRGSVNQVITLTNRKNEYEKYLNEKKELLDKEVKEYQTYTETVDNVNKAEEEYANGHYEEVERILGKMNLAYKDAGTASISELQQQSEELQAKYDALTNTIGENSNDVAKKAKEDIKNLLDETNQELQSRMDALTKQMEQAGINAALGFARGLRSNGGVQGAMNACLSLGTSAVVALNKSIEARSPSKATERTGKYFDEGFAIGIEKNKSSVIESVEDLAESSLTTAMEQAEEYKDIGNLFGENYLAGIENSFDEIIKTLEKNIDEQTEIYKDAIDEQTEVRVEKIEKQLEDLKEAHTESEKKLREQIKKTKSESQKQLLEQQSKNAKEQYNQRKKELEKDKKQIQDSNKEQIAAQKEAYKEFGKVTKEALSSAYSQIEKEAKKRVDAVTNVFQSQKDEILSIQEDLYNKTSVFDEMFEYDSETGKAKINDLNKIKEERLEYYKSLNELAERSSSKDFAKEIAGLGIDEAMAYMKEFDRMSDSQFNKVVEDWKSLNEEMKKQSEMFLQSELDELDEKYNKEMQMTIEGIKQYSREVLKGIWDEFLAILPEEFAEKIDPSTFDRLMEETEEKLSKLYGGFENVEKENSLTVLIKAETVDFAKEVTKQVPGIQEAGSEATIALGEQIGKDGKEVVSEADDVGNDTVKALESHEPEFQQVGEEYMDRLIDGMQSKWGTAVSVAHEIAESLKEELEDVASFSVRDTEDAVSARSLMESAEPAMISRLYESMVDSIGFYQSRLAAASTSYITNNESSRVENNMGDVNFNIAEVKGENADRSIKKMMEQAEFYRIQKRLAVGVK